jgi:hypothetical protein
MMERLSKTTSEGNGAQSRAVVLLRAVAPLDPSDIRKARVRAAIHAKDAKCRASHWRLSHWRLSPLAAGLALALGGGAFAAWVATNVGGVKRIETLPAAKEAPHKVRMIANNGEANKTPGFLLVPDSVSTVASERSVEGAPTAMPRNSAARKPRRQPVTRPAESEAELVARAFKAQREAKNARRAITLVDRHLAHFATGALGEEALLVGLEAATAIGDDKSLRRFAGIYLARFPDGRWAANVRALKKESATD